MIDAFKHHKRFLSFVAIYLYTFTVCAEMTRVKPDFSNIKSTFKITDLNNYKCEPIDQSIIKHVLTNGIIASDRDIHDYYSTVGCSINGTLDVNNTNTTFSFDYGGILKLGTGQTIACGKTCCENNFKYCTWNKSE